MTIETNTLSTAASIGWTQIKSNSPFAQNKQGPDNLTVRSAPNTSTFNYMQLSNTTIAAAAAVNVDLYSFTDVFGTAVTATKALGILLKATATTAGAQMRISPGNTNPLQWFFSGTGNLTTSNTITLNVGTSNTCCFMIMDGSTATINATSRNILISNPGNNTFTLSLCAIEGT